MSKGGKSYIKSKGGRPLKLTDELINKICSTLRLGSYVETAAAMNGINKKTFYDWLKRGKEKPNSIHGRLCNAVEKAMAEAEALDLAAISKARSKSWQAAAWRLQRRHPSRWAPTHREKVGNDGDETDNEFRLAYNLDDEDE